MDESASIGNSSLAPPQTVRGILMQLGPGLIIAGSIVGSGELIGTTSTGAEAGFTLLWLILIGCVIKVFTQVEMGRFTISSGETALAGMNQVPGPRWRVSWLVWYWLLMFATSLGQLGGIVGGVGQAMAMSIPLTGDFNQQLAEQDAIRNQRKELSQALEALVPQVDAAPQAERAHLALQISELRDRISKLGSSSQGRTKDDLIWAAILTVVTCVLLVAGRYGLVQNLSTALVAGFTVMTVFTVFGIWWHKNWGIGLADIAHGLSFRLPQTLPAGKAPLSTALATFGIIGVGASELVAYPYWCLEKGYARFTGPRNASSDWVLRAKGWLRVLTWDAWCSMLVYTFATVAFYLLGAAVLHRQGLNPSGSQMIRTLGEMYVPVFGEWTRTLFLVGAFAVLYSTFFVANASHARVATDCLRIFKLTGDSEDTRRNWVRLFSGLFPAICLVIYVVFPEPKTLILLAGTMQAIMLPMLGGAALFMRYCRSDQRLAPSIVWDILLWLSVGGLFLAGGWHAVQKLLEVVKSVLG